MAPSSKVVIIVDVLSFTTCVEVAVSRGARVFPYRYKDDSAKLFAKSVNALLAGKRGEGPSLSPASLQTLNSGSCIVLPSPNGSSCTMAAAACGVNIIAASLRSAQAVAEYLQSHYNGEAVTVIACGEHWLEGMLRPAIEDLIGAGAVLSHFDEAILSPEAKVAAQAFQQCQHMLLEMMTGCSSGRELRYRSFPEDVVVASELNVSRAVPLLQDGAYDLA